MDLRKVGGSVMLAVPPAVFDILHLDPGAPASVAVEGDRLVVAARPRPRYALADLLAQCDADAEASGEDRHWTASAPLGGEIVRSRGATSPR